MAFGMLFPNTELMLLFFPFPIKAKYFVMLYGAYELYAGIQRNPGDNVAHYAHLGGMLFAFILIKVWEKDKNHFY
jgi:membrane associated rhomboid family serine protease